MAQQSMPPMPTSHASHVYALIPCAGSGTRAGANGPKQYRKLAGRPMVAHTLEAFRALGDRFAAIALVVSADDRDIGAALPAFPAQGERLLQVGGATRAASVRNGLVALRQQGAHAHDWVLVHDAARCLIAPTQIEALIAACEHDPVGGLLAHRMADTLKVASPDGRVSATLARADKWLAQTPQMFRLATLQRALAQVGADVTDEAGAVEALGLQPLLVPGAAENFKLTWPPDFDLAARLLETRR